jgi:hypothetical protein
VRARRKIERRRRWIAGTSERDWVRLAERAEQVLAGGAFARMGDLDAPIAIAVCDLRERHLPNGERFGTLKGCVLLAFPKGLAQPCASIVTTQQRYRIASVGALAIQPFHAYCPRAVR